MDIGTLDASYVFKTPRSKKLCGAVCAGFISVNDVYERVSAVCVVHEVSAVYQQTSNTEA